MQSSDSSITSINDIMVSRGTMIFDYEYDIDDLLQLYLITWSPDPAEMPDADFYVQHQTNIGILTDFLKGCYLGIFCVESTQLGNPHYHGWYQDSNDPLKTELRISCIKTMKRFGQLKIVKARSYRKNSYSKHANCLYYYKKDLFDSMLLFDPNPIVSTTETTMNFDELRFVDVFGSVVSRKSLKLGEQRVSDLKFYKEFYGDTLAVIDMKTVKNVL